MKISRDWLQTYFEKELPKTEDLARGITMHAFEIEEVVKNGKDEVLDVKVLPNRAHDCLCHYGIAKEVSAIFELPLKKKPLNVEVQKFPESNVFSVEIKSKKVKRFKTLYIKGVKVTPSPSWLKTRIEAMGGKSINNVVDITNFVMFEIGQPMHAFDADKLIEKDGALSFVVREATEGEKTKTLDGVERTLNEGAILITDGGNQGESILGIAGIKGGASAEITNETKNIILEAATFDAETIRRHSKLLNIRTDASVRFENALAPEIPDYAIMLALSLLEENAKGENFVVEGGFDYFPRKRDAFKIGVSVSEVNSLLGTSLDKKEITKILERLDFKFTTIENPLQKLTALAPTFVDTPYKYGASVSFDAPRSFDCASFVCFLFNESGFTQSLPRIAVDQFVYTEPVDKEALRVGDLIFSRNGEVGDRQDFIRVSDGQTIKKDSINFESIEFMNGTKVPDGVSHVGLYLGDGKVIHASGNWYKGKVVIEDLDGSPAFKNISGYRRVTENNDERFLVSIPFERLDLIAHTAFMISGNKEDLIEEIGRMYGLEHIASTLPKNTKKEVEINQDFYQSESLRKKLTELGYSEVYTYAMVSNGKVEIENPIASDKNFMRANLKDGIEKALELNAKNAPLLGLNEIKIFEIGKVFNKDSEELRVAVGTSLKGKVKVEEMSLLDALKKFEGKEEAEAHEEVSPLGTLYRSTSVYPFALRDVAVWVPENITGDEVEKVIRDNAGEYLFRMDKFDEFKKEGKISYAYHLVFQSMDRTLSENELNKSMEDITNALNAKEGWQVR